MKTMWKSSLKKKLIPKHLGSCFFVHFPFLHLRIFWPINLNPSRHRYLASERLMSMVIMVLLFGGFFRISCNSFPHPRSEKRYYLIIFFCLLQLFIYKSKQANLHLSTGIKKRRGRALVSVKSEAIYVSTWPEIGPAVRSLGLEERRDCKL